MSWFVSPLNKVFQLPNDRYKLKLQKFIHVNDRIIHFQLKMS